MDCSLEIRYRIKSAIVPIFISCFFPNSTKSDLLAILPSSFRISTITDAGVSPASLAKSQPASVCPALVNTPPGLAMRGKIWPG